MECNIDDLPVLFPYSYLYPEQYAYMVDLKKTLDVGGKCVLEMPSGSGKTVALLSFLVAYQQHYPSHRKVVFCSRTVSDVEKTIVELKALIRFRTEWLKGEEKFTSLGITSRKNPCLYPPAGWESIGKSVENSDLEAHNAIPNGVWTLDDLLTHGEQQKQSAYLILQKMIQDCNLLVCSHHYLLDPKTTQRVSEGFSEDCIVIFDEAQNIDNVCIESLSTEVTEASLKQAAKDLQSVESMIKGMRDADLPQTQETHEVAANDIKLGGNGSDESYLGTNSGRRPVVSGKPCAEPVPGNIRKSEHFISLLKRFIEYLKTRIRAQKVISEAPSSFLADLHEHTFIERKPLKFCTERLASLLAALNITNNDAYQSLLQVAAFATLIATYEKGFLLILDPSESQTNSGSSQVLHFTCLDSAIAIMPIFGRFRSTIITSGTISPLEMYPKILNFRAVVQRSYKAVLARRSFSPLIVTRGSDQSLISTTRQARNEPSVVRNYGNLLTEFAKITPDGIVVFFPSYHYMESIITMWQGMGIMDEMWKHKAILVETSDAQETSFALETYRTACCNGHGAVFLCVARGKVSDAIEFDHQYGRTVICMGLPFQNTESHILKARLEFLRETYGIRENDFLSFDSMRNVAQCLGRILRGKDDYGIMVLADRLFQKKRAQLPAWIADALLDTDTNLSTDMAVSSARLFFKSMAQPLRVKDQEGISMWSLEDLKKHQKSADV